MSASSAALLSGVAVVNAGHVMDDAARDVAPELYADVALAGQVLIERALEQREVGVALQSFEADRPFILPTRRRSHSHG